MHIDNPTSPKFINDVIVHNDKYERYSSFFVIMQIGEHRVKATFNMGEHKRSTIKDYKAGFVNVQVFSKASVQWNPLFEIPVHQLDEYSLLQHQIYTLDTYATPQTDAALKQERVNYLMNMWLAPFLELIEKQAATILL